MNQTIEQTLEQLMSESDEELILSADRLLADCRQMENMIFNSLGLAALMMTKQNILDLRALFAAVYLVGKQHGATEVMEGLSK